MEAQIAAEVEEGKTNEGGGGKRRPSQQLLLPSEIPGVGEIQQELDEGKGVTSGTTIIPMREEFRIRRLWFFHHDIRAFTTSVGLYHWKA